MTTANSSKLGKSHRQENFPVASLLVRAEHRPVILAFYQFARTADDIADDSRLTSFEKIAALDRMEAGLLGQDASDGQPEAAALRHALAGRGLSPRHAQDLLKAFRIDADKRRYADWADLMAYCANSAAPVGRFVLDVHGENPSTWAASDAVCSALQIINHLQDCGDDFRALDRVYIPIDRLAAHGVPIDALGAGKASEPLRACIRELAGRTGDLLREGADLSGEIVDWRLRLEIAVIHALALRLVEGLKTKDPLGEETHLSGLQAGGVALGAVVQSVLRDVGVTSRAPTGARI